MESPNLDPVRGYIEAAHRWTLDAVADLTPEQLTYHFGPTSPPLAWYLWHLARSADRFQASFSPRGDGNRNEPANPNRDLWHIEGIAAKWKLDPAKLGILEAGTVMSHEDAAALATQIDTTALVEYARRTFAAADQVLANLTDADLQGARTSIMEFRVDNHAVSEAPGEPTTHWEDIIFYFSHTSRHLGMMEALRGRLDLEGTITI